MWAAQTPTTGEGHGSLRGLDEAVGVDHMRGLYRRLYALWRHILFRQHIPTAMLLRHTDNDIAWLWIVLSQNAHSDSFARIRWAFRLITITGTLPSNIVVSVAQSIAVGICWRKSMALIRRKVFCTGPSYDPRLPPRLSPQRACPPSVGSLRQPYIDNCFGMPGRFSGLSYSGNLRIGQHSTAIIRVFGTPTIAQTAVWPYSHVGGVLPEYRQLIMRGAGHWLKSTQPRGRGGDLEVLMRRSR